MSGLIPNERGFRTTFAQQGERWEPDSFISGDYRTAVKTPVGLLGKFELESKLAVKIARLAISNAMAKY